MSGDGPWFSIHVKALCGFFGPKEEEKIQEVKKQVHLKLCSDEIIKTSKTSMLTLTKEDSNIVPSWDSSVVYKDKTRLEENTSGDGFTTYNKPWYQYETPYSHCEEMKHEVMKLWMLPLDSEEKNMRCETSKILILDPPEINTTQSNIPVCHIDENMLKETVKERICEFDKSPGVYTKDDKVFFMKVSY